MGRKREDKKKEGWVNTPRCSKGMPILCKVRIPRMRRDKGKREGEHIIKEYVLENPLGKKGEEDASPRRRKDGGRRRRKGGNIPKGSVGRSSNPLL